MVNILENRIVYYNQSGKDIYGIDTKNKDINQVFPDDNEFLREQIGDLLKEEETAKVYDVFTLTKDNERVLADVQIDFLDEEREVVVIEIRQKKDTRMEKALHQIDTSHRAEAMLELDGELTVYHCNKYFYRLFGAEKQSCLEHFDHKVSEGFLLVKKDKILQEIEQGLTHAMTYYTEVEILSLSGIKKWYSMDLQRRMIDDTQEKLMCTMVDIDKRIKTQDELDTVNQYFKTVQNLSDDLLFRVDVKNKTIIRTDERSKTFGLSEIQPNFPKSVCDSGVVHQEDIETYMDFGLDVLQGVEGSCEVRMRATNGEFRLRKITCRAVYNNNGTLKEMFGKLEDVQEVKDLEAKAKVDLLTGIYNKISFQEQVERILSQTAEDTHHTFFFIDLDDFKGINDNYGHSFGDFLLSTVGKRLKRLVRDKDVLGRIGGDEFVIFFPTLGKNKDFALSRAKAILNALNQEFHYQDKRAQIKGSVGIAVYPEQGTTYEELYQNADLALYHSKAEGKNVVTLYNYGLQSKE
ncbi:MAG: sensor domain-containing diguanylate cyclase [Eubacteriales bacterium]